jgi:hypothetical protein
VLLRETDLGNAFLLAERLRQQISGGAIEARGKKIVSVTAKDSFANPGGAKGFPSARHHPPEHHPLHRARHETVHEHIHFVHKTRHHTRFVPHDRQHASFGYGLGFHG